MAACGIMGRAEKDFGANHLGILLGTQPFNHLGSACRDAVPRQYPPLASSPTGTLASKNYRSWGNRMTVGKGKRPRDPNQLAKWIVDRSTSETPEENAPAEIETDPLPPSEVRTVSKAPLHSWPVVR